MMVRRSGQQQQQLVTVLAIVVIVIVVVINLVEADNTYTDGARDIAVHELRDDIDNGVSPALIMPRCMEQLHQCETRIGNCPECRTKKVCRASGGRCQKNTISCNGTMVDVGCRGDSCTCCLQSNLCKIRKTCRRLGGSCIPDCRSCSGHIIYSACKGNCACCIPLRSGSKTSELTESMTGLIKPSAAPKSLHQKHGSNCCRCKKACKRSGGTCQQNTIFCNGTTVDVGCRGHGCTCCIQRCKIRRTCSKLGGSCISDCRSCSGHLIYSACKGNCVCCIPPKSGSKGTSTTTSESTTELITPSTTPRLTTRKTGYTGSSISSTPGLGTSSSSSIPSTESSSSSSPISISGSFTTILGSSPSSIATKSTEPPNPETTSSIDTTIKSNQTTPAPPKTPAPPTCPPPTICPAPTTCPSITCAHCPTTTRPPPTPTSPTTTRPPPTPTSPTTSRLPPTPTSPITSRPPPTPTSPTGVRCAPQFFLLGDECFNVSKAEASWGLARIQCDKMGPGQTTFLAEPKDSAALAQYVFENYKRDHHYWLGARGTGSSIDWWSGGNMPNMSLTTEPWMDDQPSSFSDKFCLDLRIDASPLSKPLAVHECRFATSHCYICESSLRL